LAWFVLNPFGPEAWRFIFLIGVIPALFALYVRARVPESATWRDAMHAKRWTATEADADGTVRIPQSKRRLTLVEIFSTPVSRRRVLLTLVLSVCSLSAYYTISTTSVRPHEVGGLAVDDRVVTPCQVTSAGILDLDDVRPEIGEVAATERPCHCLLKRDHPQSLQR